MGGTTCHQRPGREGRTFPARATIVVGVLLAVALAPRTPVAAESAFDWGYTGGSDPNRAPDSRDHWHCKTNFGLHHDWLNSAMEQLDVQTVMYRQDASSCGSSTDVVWVQTALGGIDGGEYVAKTTCVDHVSWGVCDQFWVLIDQPWYYAAAFTYGSSDPGTWYARNLQARMRHEVGHTAGLHHWGGSLTSGFGAMNSATIPNGTSGWLTYLAYASFHEDLIDGNV